MQTLKKNKPEERRERDHNVMKKASLDQELVECVLRSCWKCMDVRLCAFCWLQARTDSKKGLSRFDRGGWVGGPQVGGGYGGCLCGRLGAVRSTLTDMILGRPSPRAHHPATQP